MLSTRLKSFFKCSCAKHIIYLLQKSAMKITGTSSLWL